MDKALDTQVSIPSLEESLRLGQSFHLEFDGLPSLNGGYHLWGICPSQSIMVSAPQLKLTDELLNTSVKARLFIEQLDNACAFRTTVANLCSMPSNYLHLNMPTSIVTGEVRRNHRARTSVQCEVSYGDSPASLAEMIDVSICGCRINTTMNDLKVGDAIDLVFEINIYGINQKINVSAMVRSRAEVGSGYTLGAQFIEMSDCHRIAMNSFINKHC